MVICWNWVSLEMHSPRPTATGCAWCRRNKLFFSLAFLQSRGTVGSSAGSSGGRAVPHPQPLQLESACFQLSLRARQQLYHHPVCSLLAAWCVSPRIAKWLSLLKCLMKVARSSFSSGPLEDAIGSRACPVAYLDRGRG